MTDAALSALILGLALVLFVSERIRHDLVALLALFACWITGLVPIDQALRGFAAPAVVTVAAVLVVGRAIELSGAAAVLSRRLVPSSAPFIAQFAIILLLGTALSAFMNNIAALVLTMPVAIQIARDSGRSAGAVLMPLSFATILGGMLTVIGTPANLILSNIREDELGEPFGFFAMSPVASVVTLAGLVYLVAFGWRLLPSRKQSTTDKAKAWGVYELAIPAGDAPMSVEQARRLLAAAHARPLTIIRGSGGGSVGLAYVATLDPGDRLFVLSRQDLWSIARTTGLDPLHERSAAADAATARVVVANGSFLIGQPYSAVQARSAGELSVIGAGPRAARMRLPLAEMLIQPGDQLYIHGSARALADLIRRARLLELDRVDLAPPAPRRATLTVVIYGAAILAAVAFGVPPVAAFLGAAIAIAALRLIPGDEVYRSIDWSIIVLLAAMIPVGRSFENSGAAAQVAQWLGEALATTSPFMAIAAICTVTMLLSIFLNNVATAVIMGPIAIDLAAIVGFSPDALLLAVLIGASSDFLTPIGHHNNTLVMGPGGYRFTDYMRVGAILVVIVVGSTAAVLSASYG